MPDFLLELLSEEIPARMQGKAQQDLARLFSEQLSSAGLKAEAVETYATPRRLVLIARGLSAETAAVREETKGPRASAPPQALEGFLRKTGLTREQLEERDGIYFATVEKPGRPTSAVLAEAIPAVVRAFPWPKSMRWGAASASTESPRWVRPLQGIVALLGEEIVDFEIAGVRSGAATLGHRFHHPGAITLGGANDYVEKLQACHVVVDPAERRRIIAEGANAAAAAAGLALVEDDGLLAENAGLTEWPVPLLGSFDPAFLDVPREVIQLTMRTNQKYFALTDGEGKLAPNFVCVANIEASDGGEAIVAGNRKVLAARLADARYCSEHDLKIPLEEQAKKLSQIVFHEKHGTVADKVERVAQLAGLLVRVGLIEGIERIDAERAARLAKADLVTGMVGEFPELQGVMGRYYFLAQNGLLGADASDNLPLEGRSRAAQPLREGVTGGAGLDTPHSVRPGGRLDLPRKGGDTGASGAASEEERLRAIADAIRDHYKPQGPTDSAPTEPVSVAVAVADKLDTLVGFWAIDEKPTGSKDPYALRRAALGVIRIVLENEIRLSLVQTMNSGIDLAYGSLAGAVLRGMRE